ncbi:putative monooxygenase [Annulohypoxylon bovei var. microspora]|nr:putative monooxygenase [Annulohypoxylon bovei var. microspora]
MAPLKILVCGGGIGGPALAFWLARTGHRVVVVERYPALRATGAQVDLREQGIELVKMMGLDEVIRSKLVDEAGFALVDSHDRIRATVLANRSGKGAQSFTSEYEIMRGDMVRILYDQTKDADNVEYVFGKTVESFEQDDDAVQVRFSDGSSDTFDLLVGADGQGSRIRRAILPPNTPEPYRRLGVYIAYWFIPRTAGDTNISRSYVAPGGRMVFRRSHNPTETQAYFFLNDDDPALQSIPKVSVEKQKEFWAQRYQDAGWQMGRFIEGMKTTENFYCQEVVQVLTDTWSKGRVVLLGDAAHCSSPFSGMGTTGALVGAYVLAGEIARNPDNLPQALASYDEKLRPFVDVIQNINIGTVKFGIPKSWWGVKIVYFVAWLVCLLRIPTIIEMFSRKERGGWKIPDYPELKPAR